MLSIKRLCSRNRVTNRRQADLIVLDRQNDPRISVDTHRFANRRRKNHPTVTGYFNVYRLGSHRDALPQCVEG